MRLRVNWRRMFRHQACNMSGIVINFRRVGRERSSPRRRSHLDVQASPTPRRVIAAAKVHPAPGIELVERPEPDPAFGEVLVQVRYCGICGSDLPVYRWSGQAPKWSEALPRVMGHEFAGTVATIGAGVDAERFPPGTPIAVEPGVTCGTCRACRDGHPNLCGSRSIVGIDREGAFAPLVAVPQQNLFPLPPDLDLRRAAFLEVLAIAVHCVERAKLTPGDRALVVGSGPIGLAIAALARMAGCSEVVVAGIEADQRLRLPLARAMGATTACLSSALLPDGAFDQVFEASGAGPAVRTAIEQCRIGGRVIAVGAAPGMVEVDWDSIVLRAITITPVRARLTRHWVRAAEVAGAMPIPDTFFSVFPLARVDEAFTAIEDGAAVKVLIEAPPVPASAEPGTAVHPMGRQVHTAHSRRRGNGTPA
jgi:threonine dehydrogenase-like Zn-dependent dehydrogenase